jgi:hypothetical protein
MSTTKTIKIKTSVSGPTKNLQKGHYNTHGMQIIGKKQVVATVKRDNS